MLKFKIKNETKQIAASTNTTDGYGFVKNPQQTRNNGKKIIINDELLDDTEGLGAMDTLPFEPNTRNLDIGGGKFDTISNHLYHFYKVKNYVYDPYNRSKKHNHSTLQELKDAPADTVTSIGVLNVIHSPNERKKHIELAHHYLKKNGLVFFKIFRGNATSIPDNKQSNKSAAEYVSEVNEVFGEKNVSLIKDDIGNTIFARKKI